MTKMPEPENPYAGCYHEGEFHRSTWAEAFDAGALAQRELLEGWVKLPSEERLAEILTGCFIAWQRDEENKTFPEYVAKRLYKELTEAK